MSILNNLRRAFGFVTDDDEMYLDDEQAAHADSSAPSEPEAKAEPLQAPAPTIPADTDAEAIAAEMMSAVVELFNSFQPDFIAKCLDSDRQKKILAESMAPALRGKIEAIAAAERDRIVREASTERATLDADLRKMRERNAELEKRRMAFKDEQLSATRQKRALQERVHDLETQTEQLAAEKEQLELENRSMANKLRVAGISGPVPAPAPAENSEEADRLREEIERLTSENGSLNAELSRLRDEAEKSAVEASAAQETISQLNNQLADLKDISGKADLLADTLAKKESRIAELKSRIKEAEDAVKTVERLQDENKSLRSTIEANLYEHAAEMSGLRREIEELRTKAPRRGRPRKEREKPGETADTKPTEAKPAKTAPRITAIDELIESSEWLVAPTPEEVRLPVVEEPSDDFGYRAPARKPAPHDDANQLTLF